MDPYFMNVKQRAEGMHIICCQSQKALSLPIVIIKFWENWQLLVECINLSLGGIMHFMSYQLVRCIPPLFQFDKFNWILIIRKTKKVSYIFGIEANFGVWGIVVALDVIKYIFVQLLVISEKAKPKAESTSKSRGRRKNGIMKEDKFMDNSFELLGILNRDFYIAQTNYPWTCLLSLYRFSFFLSICLCSRLLALLSLKWQGAVQRCTLWHREQQRFPKLQNWLQYQIYNSLFSSFL